MYLPDTNVLLTRFLSPDGVAEVTDFMPIGEPAPGHGLHDLVRRVEVVRGSMPMRAFCRPAFDYARADHRVELVPSGARFLSRDLGLGLLASVPLRAEGPAAVADFVLRQGEQATFLLSPPGGGRSAAPSSFSLEETERAFREHGRLLAPLARPVQLPRALAGDGAAAPPSR